MSTTEVWTTANVGGVAQWERADGAVLPTLHASSYPVGATCTVERTSAPAFSAYYVVTAAVGIGAHKAWTLTTPGEPLALLDPRDVGPPAYGIGATATITY